MPNSAASSSRLYFCRISEEGFFDEPGAQQLSVADSPVLVPKRLVLPVPLLSRRILHRRKIFGAATVPFRKYYNLSKMIALLRELWVGLKGFWGEDSEHITFCCSWAPVVVYRRRRSELSDG